MLPEQPQLPDPLAPSAVQPSFRQRIPGWLWATGWVVLILCICSVATAAGAAALLKQPDVSAIFMTPTPAVLPPAAWAARLIDPFASNENKWGELDREFTEGTVVRKVERAMYHWDVDDKQDEFWFDFPGTDFQLEDSYVAADAHMTSGYEAGTEYGLIIRYANNDNFYLFRVAENGYWDVDVKSNGKWDTLKSWTRTSDIKSGETNKLAAMAQGNVLTFYINGQLQGTITDDKIPRGEGGLMAGASKGVHLVMDFDNFEVYALPGD